jgi:hypothetical protein
MADQSAATGGESGVGTEALFDLVLIIEARKPAYVSLGNKLPKPVEDSPAITIEIPSIACAAGRL